MSKETYYVCSQCGTETLKWMGQCSTCKEWNTLREFKVEHSNYKQGNKSSRLAEKPASVYRLNEIKSESLTRIGFDLPAVSNVLGGGIARGSLLLFGGNPGVGKSTLLLTIAHCLKEPILYVTAEESLEQIKDRSLRIKPAGSNVLYLAQTNFATILATVEKVKPKAVVIDSIQTIFDPSFTSSAGSLVQVREIALGLQKYAKASGISFIIVGHVTKEGNIAGPKILEHIVDGVFYMEVESDDLRLLRSAKNRFGSTQEVALLKMEKDGIKEVQHPEKAFLEQRQKNLPGSVITAVIEGTRALLVEIQALVVPTIFGYPRRSAVGIHPQRLELILAVLERRAKVSLRNFDVFVKATAGFVAKEASVDLAIALALVSAHRDKVVSSNWCIFGEVGLLGEVILPSDAQTRKKAAASLGYNQFVNSKNIDEAIKEILSSAKKSG
jgi:DNA repair protein RadA/Sms